MVEIPSKITVVDAIKLIARNYARNRIGGRGLSKEEMVTIARAACLTEGIDWRQYGLGNEPNSETGSEAAGA